MRYLEELFTRYGFRENVLTDNDPQFDRVTRNVALNRWETAHCTTTVYHLRAKPTERRNQEMNEDSPGTCVRGPSGALRRGPPLRPPCTSNPEKRGHRLYTQCVAAKL